MEKEIEFLQRIAKNIKTEIDMKINSLYNHRKKRLGLVSIQNNMLENLKIKVEEWYLDEITLAKRIEKITIKKKNKKITFWVSKSHKK